MRHPRRNRQRKGPKLSAEEARAALPHVIDGMKTLIGRTIGAALFLEHEAEPKIRAAATRSIRAIEDIATATAASLSRQLHEGKTKNDQRRVRER